MKLVLLIFLLFYINTLTYSQSTTIDLQEYTIKEDKLWRDSSSMIGYYRLKYTVLKFKPLLDTITSKLKEIDSILTSFEPNKSKSYVINEEKKYKNYYSKFFKELNREEGTIFLKLLARQTGYSCYDLIKKYKGKAAANKWLLYSKINFMKINAKYNPDNDKTFENIARCVL